MGNNKNNTGFALVEGLLVVITLTLIVGVGFYVMNANKDKDATTTNTAQNTAKPQVKPESKVKYLSIPEEGIKIRLSDDIKDAYYYKSQQGYIYLSTRTLDNTKGAETCAAKDTDGMGGGLVSLVVGKVGQPNDSIASEAPWTQQELDESGLKKVGDTYYGFQHGNGPCWDVDNEAAGQRVNDTIEAFVRQQPTIIKQ